MSRKAEEPELPPRTGDVSAAEIIDLFLDWTQKNRERLTYEAYKRRLQAFVDSIPASLLYTAMKPHHVTRAMDANAEKWNANTKNDFATAVQRAFNWAQGEGLITHNPLARVRKPGREARELAINPAQYAEIMQAASEPNFRTLLEVAWETGARPQELVKIEARHVDLERRRIVFPPREAKGKKRYRVIYLGTDWAVEIMRGLCEERLHGVLLRNSEGQAWTKDAVNCAFCRLKEKLGVKYYLGAFRKGVSHQPEAATGIRFGQLAGQFGGGQGATLMPGLSFLAIKSPEHRQAEVAILAKRQGDGDTQDHPVQAEPQRLVFLGRKHSVEEDAAERDLGPALVAERIIDDQPDHPPGDQVAQNQSDQNHAQVIPLSRSGMADGVGGIMMAFGCQTSGLSDLADSVGTETDDPTRDQNLEGVEDFDSEAITEGFYQRGEARDKLIHGAGLRANSVFGVLKQPQDTESAGVCPLLLSH